MDIDTHLSYGKAGDNFLTELYATFGADSNEKKLKVLTTALRGPHTFHLRNGHLIPANKRLEMEIGGLEHELLEREGHIRDQILC